MAGDLYAPIAQITDPVLRAALKRILEHVGTLQGKVADIGTVSAPLTDHLDANGKLLRKVADPLKGTDAVNLQTLQRYVQMVGIGITGTAPQPAGPAPNPSPAPSPTPTPVPGPVPPEPPPGPVPPGPPAPIPEPTPIPSTPARDAACSVTCSMQGLTVVTGAYGSLPYWEGIIGWFNASDRQAMYAAKHAAGDTHCGVQLSGQYAEAGQPYEHIPGVDWTTNLVGWAELVAEVAQNGFIPLLFLAGDGEGAGPGYNDPVGLTYGWQWLMNNLASIVNALKGSTFGDLTTQCLFSPGYDGVFYGWDPSQVSQFGQLFRSLLPNGYLAIEHNTGHIPLGNGPADYDAGGPMRSFDVILSEFDPSPPRLHQDSLWQIAGRLLGPAYVRPPDQPAGDDPSPPWYLAPGTPRGPYFTCAFEVSTYYWVRSGVSAGDVADDRLYLRTVGYTDLG